MAHFSAVYLCVTLAGFTLVLEHQEPAGHSLWLGPIFVGFLLANLASAAAALVLMNNLNQAWEAAEERRRAGDYAGALAALEKCARHRRVPRSHATSLYEMGCCLQRLGRFDRAIELFGAVDRHRARNKLDYQSVCAGRIALCHALAGRLTQADLWGQQTERPEREGWNAELPFVTAKVLGARFQQAEFSDEDAVRLEGLYRYADPESVREARVLLAFVAEQAGRPRAFVERLLQGALGARPNEYDYLGSAWPEMAVFLARLPGKNPQFPN